MIFKVAFAKKIHLIKLAETTTLEDLKKSISHAFKLETDKYSMFYVDEDGD